MATIYPGFVFWYAMADFWWTRARALDQPTAAVWAWDRCCYAQEVVRRLVVRSRR
jgi:hypothetical protein